MKALFQKARDEGKWFWCVYQGLWFSPDELEAYQNQGKFCWGAVNWKLRDPQTHIAALKRRIEQAEEELSNFKRRLEGT